MGIEVVVDTTTGVGQPMLGVSYGYFNIQWTLLSRHTLSKLMSDSFHEIDEHNIGKLLVKQLLELPA